MKERGFKMTTEKKIDRILVELKTFREDVGKRFEQVDKRFEQMDKRFDDVDRRFVKVEKELGETYKLAQRANVMFEKLNSDVQQIAEGVIEVRHIARRLEDHDDRISELEWRVDMHDKFLKKTA